MTTELHAVIQRLPFEQLRTLHREVGALIAEKRQQELQELRERAAILGFTPQDFTAQKGGRANAKYRDGDGNTWSGKGKRPAWLQAKLAEGHDLSEFAAA